MEVTLIIRTVPCLRPQLAAGVPLLGACVQRLNRSSTPQRYVEGESEQEKEATHSRDKHLSCLHSTRHGIIIVQGNYMVLLIKYCNRRLCSQYNKNASFCQ